MTLLHDPPRGQLREARPRGPRRQRPLRIAMVGQRGLPATYGGIERHVEEVGRRLAERGHEVTVFCRAHYAPDARRTYEGMRLRAVPTIASKHLDAVVHSVLCTLVAAVGRYDVVHYHGVGPGLASVALRLLGAGRRGPRVVLTVHGLDGERAKWGGFASTLLRLATWASARVPHATVGVSAELGRHYADTYGRDVTVIVNGATPARDVAPGTFLARHGLEPGHYALFVGRLVPEKAPDLLIEAFGDVPTDWHLVLAGDSSFTDGFAERVRGLAAADPRVVLPGYVYGDDLHELYGGAGLFVLPSELEGLPLTLLEAVAAGVPVLASDIAPHLEILRRDAPGGRLFPTGDRVALTAALRRLVREAGAERAGAPGMRADVVARFRWDTAAEQLEALYRSLLRG